MVPDFSEFIVPDRSGILLATAAAIAIGTIDGARYRVHNNTNKTSPIIITHNPQREIGPLNSNCLINNRAMRDYVISFLDLFLFFSPPPSSVICRRLSTENSLKLDSRLVPNLFRGKDQGHHHQQHHQHHHNNPISSGQPPAGAQPKLGYRSMVSVDDVPELFASLDSKYLDDFYIFPSKKTKQKIYK